MGRPGFELVVSLLAVAVITAGYAFLAQDVVPTPKSAVGYTLGIIGFVLMLATETLYSLRKRSQGIHLGPMAFWLQLHIVTGIVGPYLVLLHTGWRFNSLAGL